MTSLVQALNEEEKKMLSKYGKLPQRKDLLSQKLNVYLPLALFKTRCVHLET